MNNNLLEFLQLYIKFLEKTTIRKLNCLLLSKRTVSIEQVRSFTQHKMIWPNVRGSNPQTYSSFSLQLLCYLFATMISQIKLYIDNIFEVGKEVKELFNNIKGYLIFTLIINEKKKNAVLYFIKREIVVSYRHILKVVQSQKIFS